MTLPITLCSECKHLFKSKKGMPSCRAYPNGIPREILTLEADHTKPYKGDNGIQFEPIEKD